MKRVYVGNGSNRASKQFEADMAFAQAVLKLFGFVPDWAVDKFLQLKHLTGLWV